MYTYFLTYFFFCKDGLFNFGKGASLALFS